MIPALLHGKSGPEDSLTSTVFGVLSTLPTAIGLGPWFSTALPFDPGAEPLSSLSEDYRVLYWPSLRYGEARVVPDLILETATTRLVIEAKLGAGPTGQPGTAAHIEGQLGRQWVAATGQPDATDRVVSIYLTADWSMPRATLGDMVREVDRRPDVPTMRPHLFWLSWRSLERVLLTTAPTAGPVARAVDMLVAYLRRHGLRSFVPAGCPPLQPLSWSYRRAGPTLVHLYLTSISSPPLTWSYTRQ
jgi:hypothetical protein